MIQQLFFRDVFFSRWFGLINNTRFFRNPTALKSQKQQYQFSNDCEQLDDALRFDVDELLEAIVEADLEPALPILLADRIEFALYRALGSDFTKIYPALEAIVSTFAPETYVYSSNGIKQDTSSRRRNFELR